MKLLEKLFGSYSEKEVKRVRPIADAVLALEGKYAAMSDGELQGMTPKLKERLAAGETLDDILPDAFAVCREAAWRVLEMKHFPVQVIGGIILHQGRIAEMRTGEGKTLVATLPAYLNALAGKGVHVVTVNDYLARRDSEWMGKLYRYLGLTVGLVVSGMEPDEKRAAYNADITYGTNNEFGFDYLRDNMVVYRKNLVQRGFNYAIVDEVDSILIDEARTPLIISGQGQESGAMYKMADDFAKTLKCLRVREVDDKEEQDDVDADYIVDEKAKTATITPKGAAKAETYFHVESLNDPENVTLSHHINQAIKARGVMKKDVDYVVKDGEVVIVDEFTGRLMIGRRFSEGLHQAIEAKEGVSVLRESKTLATITFQNFFRMYDKLAGMTGTAMTEESEFREIYKLDVVEIPTNKPVARIDHPDVVYKTMNGKYRAVINLIKECHAKGQPILVGTVSIDKSELLSSMLKREGIAHSVLNAKYHEKEAEIVAQAGKFGAVTISTNMAGRGTDIMLGGNAEYLAKADMRREGFTDEMIYEATAYGETKDEEILSARKRFRELLAKHKAEIAPEADKVRAVGGLYIVGTERHESRRIDNQLRGRAGRQGDPGETRFFISLEDDLMRLFGGDRVQGMMNTLGVSEDDALENKTLTSVIESSQKKLEGRNFQIRKTVLQYDDVMNQQREAIYSERRKVLNGEDISESIKKMMHKMVSNVADRYLYDDELRDEWNLSGLRDYFMGWLTKDGDFSYTTEQLNEISREDIIKILTDRADSIYAAKEKLFGSDLMREIERMVLLRNVDTQWMDHIDAMDALRQGIGLRSIGQKDPVVEYRMEGYEMFEEMNKTIQENTVRQLLTFKIRINAPMTPQQRSAVNQMAAQANAPAPEPVQVKMPAQQAAPAPAAAQPVRQEIPRNVLSPDMIKREQVAVPTSTSADGTVKNQPVRRKAKIGRNDPCPCGSGLKYKKCCGKNEK